MTESPVAHVPIRRPPTTTLFHPSSTASDLESDGVVERIPELAADPNTFNQETSQRNEDRSGEDTNDEEPVVAETSRTNAHPSSSSAESPLRLFCRAVSSAERLENMWSEVNERIFRYNAEETERRINLCYRNLVDQYQSVVRRYCDISRNRDTVNII